MTRSGQGVPLEPLTERELEILHLLAEGLTNREIAQRLILSLETIKWYNRQIYSKLDVGSRTQAAAKASEIGLFDESGETVDVSSTPETHHLPAQLSSFVGRQQEIAEVQRLLARSRLITLTGPGGVGKTRLGLQVAASVTEDYADGVVFVSLLAASNESQVPKVIAQVLGIVERRNQDLAGTLKRYLHKKEMLLLLDNFEHVLPAAPLVTDLLASAPQLTILATSREALHLTGEHEYLVPPLTMPDPNQANVAGDVSAAESVTLFVQRARAASSMFHLSDANAAAIAGICLRLDGLPLAIELAAARIKLFSPQQLLERLQDRLGILVGGPRDLPDRQRTLRDTIDWSYNLLDEADKSLFARLAVFRNGSSLEAIEVVCGFEPVGDALNGASSLLNKSLLYQEEGRAGEPRFYMLETIHEYAQEKLSERGEKQEVQDRHLAYFVSLAEEMEPGYLGHNQLSLLSRTEAEMGNIRAAFDWAWERDQIEAAARLISAVDYYFRYKDGLVEGYQWFQRVAERLDEIPQPHDVRLFIGAGRLAWYNNDFDQGKRYYRQAHRLLQSLDEKQLEATCLVEYPFDPDNLEDLQKAKRYCEAGVAIFREQNYEPGIAHALNILGEIVRVMGDKDRAKEVYEEALAFAQKTGELNRQDMLKANLGFIAYQEGRYEQARDIFISIVKYRTESRIWQWTITALSGLAGPLSRLGEPEKAARLLGANAALMGEFGIDHQPGDQSIVAQFLSDVKAQLDEDAFAAAWEEGQAMTLQQAVAYALDE